MPAQNTCMWLILMVLWLVRSSNTEVIKRILAKVKIPVQVGGGIRTLANIENMLALGVTRVILGSVAVRNPELVREVCQKFPGQVVVGIDAKNGEVAVEGWGIGGAVSAPRNWQKRWLLSA